MQTTTLSAHSRFVQATLATLALVCLMLALAAFPGPASADGPLPLDSDPGKCALCHQAEVQDWSNSPHAGAMSALDADMTCEDGQDCSACLTCHTTNFSATTQTFDHAGVTCEACHGPYVEGHPENGQMALSVDSAVCNDCHTETFQDWQHTKHAQAGVQCIGCHRSHTQNLRLDDEVLCKSCHRDELQDGGHLVHMQTGINCVSCHTSPATLMGSTEGPSSPSHQFAVAPEACASCHGDSFHEATTSAMLSAGQPALSAALDQSGGIVKTTTSSQAPSPAEFVAEKSTERRVVEASAVSLGVGIGIGAMAGIIFMLVVSVLIQRPWRTKS